jgi:hypothetical protein
MVSPTRSALVVSLVIGAAALTTPPRHMLSVVGLESAGSAVVHAAADRATLVLSPQDTSLSLNTKNYSGLARLMTYTWPDYKVANAIVMKFDLSALPAGAVIDDATLHLALVQSDSSADIYTIGAHKLVNRNPVIAKATGHSFDGAGKWTANGCCYQQVPLAQADISPAYDARAIDKVPGFKVWNVTAMAQEWLQDPSNNFGVLLNSDASKARDRFRYFASMEHADSGLRPYLRVTYLTTDAIPPAVTITAPADNATAAGTVTVSASASDNAGVDAVRFHLDGAPLGAELAAAPYVLDWDTTTVPDGAYTLTAVARDWSQNTSTSAGVRVTVTNGIVRLSPQDTSLNIDATNSSSQPSLTTYTWPDYKVANAVVMKFDVSALPPGGVVEEATLHLALVESDATADSTYTIGAHRILGKNPLIAQATGYTFDGVTGWTATACCYNGVPLAQADISSAYDQRAIDKATGFKTWTITTMVQDWLLDPAINFGLLLNSDASRLRDRYRLFASMEHADAGLRPFLLVRYSVVDLTPPSVSITAPANGATVAGTVTMSASASDNLGVASVEFLLDGTAIGDDTTIPYSVVWNTTAAPNGLHTLTAVARDAAGNVTTSSAVTVTVANDTTAPVISGVTASSVTSSQATIAWTTDEASDSQVEYGPTTAYGSVSPLNGALVTSHVVTLSGLADTALHHFRVRSRDAAGNSTTSADFTFTTLDGTNPSASITAPAGGTTVSGTLTVAASATDNVGLVGVQFKRNGVNLGAEDTTAPYSVSWNTTTVGNGSYTLTAVARDGAGNQAASAGVIVTVANDTAPPSVSVTAPINGAAAFGLVTVAASASDNVGVASVQFTLDGVNLGTQDTTAPYSILWDTATTTDGSHTLTAVARDAAGNAATSAGVIVTVANGPIQVALTPQDTFVGLDAMNNSTSTRLMAYTWPDNRVANAILLKFDLSGIPAGVVVQDATLQLGLVESDATADSTYTVSAHKLVGRNPVLATATGYTADGVTSWTANACCYNAVPLAQADISPAYDTRAVDKTAGYKTWTVTSMVQEWMANPTANFGLLLNSDASKLRDRYRGFASMEHLDANLRPFLRVTYALSSDTTRPSAAITTPAAGATVSGTVTVGASASDNVGVVGVQFKLDGTNLGAEDTTAPYTAAWNTTTAAPGSHTLTAVARDAAGNQTVAAAVIVTVSAPPSTGGIATLYPGDAGIESHPDVVFTEMFEQSSIATMIARYTNVAHSAGMSFGTSTPAGSGGNRSLQMSTDGSANTAATLYKTLPNDQQWYLRYYVNYNSAVAYSHSGVWLGGYNPVLSYPNPQAGTKPAGNDRFSTGVEPLSFDSDRWMPYTYWKDMRISGDGKYWGNVFLPSDATIRMARNRWYCVETMVKLNSPVTDANGELAVWIDGQKVIHLGKGFPNGAWSGGTFTENATGAPFGGFQWRSDSALNLNWIWLQNYVTGVPSTVQFDHVVLARSYVGCLAGGSVVPDTTAPSVSLSAPTAGATVSGTAVTVSANASDNVGIAGVQFKLDGVNLGAEAPSAPYAITWNTTTVANGSHTLTAVARDAAGNTTTAASIPVTVSNATSTALWPNEPTGFVQVNDQPWNLLTGNGWNYLRRSASKNADIVTDSAAPLSPSNLLRMIFTTDMGSNHEPGVHWLGLSGIKEIYTGWWIKVSPNWQCSPAGCGKMTFLFAPSGANVYTTLLNPDASQGPPFRVGLRPQWGGYDLNLLPNVATTLIGPGDWHRIEFYYKWETTPGVSGDGIIRWWVDGVLNGNHTNIRYPADNGFTEFQYAPTLQNPPTAEMYLYLDHTRVSRR